MSVNTVRLIRLLHANGWKYTLERCESRDWQGAPDQAWSTHTWTRGGCEIQTFTGDTFAGINWRPDDDDSFLSTDPRMLAKLGYDGAVSLLVALGAVAPEAWTVRKIRYDANSAVMPIIWLNGMIRREAGTSNPEHARFFAAQLLAAADEVERRQAGDGGAS